MKGIYISLALIALACQPGRNQKQLHDTLSTETSYQIDEVVVTGARQKTDVRHLSQTVSIVGRAQIENSRQSSLLPVLTEQIPGLFVTSRGIMGYGVSNGAAGSISLRGRTSAICRHLRPSDRRCLPVVPGRTGGSTERTGFCALRIKRHGWRGEYRYPQDAGGRIQHQPPYGIWFLQHPGNGTD